MKKKEKKIVWLCGTKPFCKHRTKLGAYLCMLFRNRFYPMKEERKK